MRLKILFIFPFLFAFIMVTAGNLVENGQSIYAAAVNKNMVVIDAGHGGIDPGTIKGKIFEKDITLDVAARVKHGLESKGIKVIMTRQGDSSVVETTVKGKSRHLAGLMKRVAIANENRAKALVSIHVNSSKDSRYFGPQTYYREGAVKGQKLAEMIQKELADVRMTKRRAIIGDFYLLNNSKIPAVLVELGFISNDKDLELLQQDSFRQLLADGIIAAIADYLAE